MSLIQDALKRQQEESEKNRVPPAVAPGTSSPPPSVPDTMPVSLRPQPVDQPLPAPLPETLPADTGKPGKSWKQIAGIIIFCILIVWGGGLLAVFVMKQSAQRSLDTLIPGLTTGRIVPNNKPSAPSVSQPDTAMPEPAVIPPPERSSAPIPWISPAAATAPALGDEEEESEDVALPSVNIQELPVAVPKAAPVVWPRLKLSAIFSHIGHGRAGARLNNRLILLHDQIEGVTLVEIRHDSVILKCGQETRLLKMGMTLY